ncbi:toxin-antitoxin system HicB family antitoxin [Nonomuraea typhae]|uniref:toxin-antitoxin system HicB family antitoxin n=1 Tax=Nonomuraea typhae TaxID=2603600 RepID=UPI0012FAF45F|nr:toxin-antitoxin system HicB family antitoxin [Nonomuraea typhae]
MELAPYVDHLRRELAVAAEAGGPEARATADRLIATLESATRMAMLEALSAAAAEITRELAPGSVDVRLRGRDPDFVVTPPPAPQVREAEPVATARPVRQPEADDGGTTRVALRVPEHLKPRIDEAAAREGLSVNAWLVRAVSAALDSGEAGGGPRASQGGQRYTGWVR